MSYVTEVADLFLSRCQNVSILNPMDYATIAEWEKQEIPIDIVFESLNQAFDNLPNNKELMKVDSIGYFHNEIKKNYVDWLHNLK